MTGLVNWCELVEDAHGYLDVWVVSELTNEKDLRIGSLKAGLNLNIYCQI